MTRAARPVRRPDPISALLWVLVALLAAAVVGVTVYRGWALLYPTVTERAPLNSNCDPRVGPCRVQFAANGRVTLEIRPRGIPAVQPLTIEAEIEGLPPALRVEVDFVGVDMDMGFNRVSLEPMPPTDDNHQRFRGVGMLPVCVRDRMTWEARVLLHYPDRLLAAPFRFDSLRPGAAADGG